MKFSTTKSLIKSEIESKELSLRKKKKKRTVLEGMKVEPLKKRKRFCMGDVKNIRTYDKFRKMFASSFYKFYSASTLLGQDQK